MGLFSLMSKKSASSMRTNGVVTSQEFKHKVIPALTKTFGRVKGANMENALKGNMDRDGGFNRGMTAREVSETMHDLEKNHRDNLSNKDIEKLKGIVNSQL